MRRTISALAALALLAVASGAAAQETPRARAERALPAPVYQNLVGLVTEAADQGIPPEPLYNKALEGLAKRVPVDRLVPAVEMYASRLGLARDAFGTGAGAPLLVAGADALQRGITGEALQQLGRHEGRSPMSVLVLADLVEAGVSVDRALQVLRDAMTARTREDRMLDIPVQVRRLMRDGRSPGDAIDQVRRTLTRTRGGGDLGPPVPPGSEPPTRTRPRGGGIP